MISLICGIDFSSRQIDAALIPLDPDGSPSHVQWRQEELPKTTDPTVRCRAARRAVLHLLADTLSGDKVVMVWVEEPVGSFRGAAQVLLPIYGAILSSIPSRCELAEIIPQVWRRELGLPGNASKAAAVTAANELLDAWQAQPVEPLTEHMAEALLVAVAGRQRCMRASAA